MRRMRLFFGEILGNFKGPYQRDTILQMLA